MPLLFFPDYRDAGTTGAIKFSERTRGSSADVIATRAGDCTVAGKVHCRRRIRDGE